MPAREISLTASYTDMVSVPGYNDNQKIHCYPNPAGNAFYIELILMGNSTININNLMGQSVYRAHTAEPLLLVENHHLSSGIYVIRVADCFGEVHTQKLIIQ